MPARKTTTRKAPAKKPAAKKPAAKKPVAKKPVAKKPATRKKAAPKPSAADALLEKELQKAEQRGRNAAAAEAEADKQEALKKQKAELEAKQQKEQEEAIAKATATIPVTIKHGLSRQTTVQANPNNTITELLGDPDLRAILSFGENVKAICNGRELQGSNTIESLGESPTISLETKENKKA